MGCVYLAEDPNIGRKVALKVFAPQGIDKEVEAEFQQRFVTEAMAAGRLSHPGIVTIYDAGTDSAAGSSFIAMEWVEGETLHEYLWRHGGKLSPARAAEIVRQAALALDYAHREGVIHRDVKPANILVGKDGRVRVMDFGVAKLGRQNLTTAGVLLGTPAFMSPEQVRGEKLDGRSDLFSLGTILYEALTGVHPFQAEAIAAVTFKIVNDKVAPARSLVGDVPEALSAVAAKALARSPDERFQTGAELARALEAAVSLDEPTVADLDDLGDLGDLEGLPSLDSTMFTVEASGASGTSSRRRGLLWVLGIAFLAVGAIGLWALLGPGGATPEPPGPIAEPPAVAEPRTAVAEPDPAVPPEAEELAAAQETPVAEVSKAVPESSSPPAVAEPPKEERDGPRSLRAAVPVPRATLELLYVNRLRDGEMTVLVDGREIWSQEMEARSALKRISVGQRNHIALPVTAGEHSIEIRIKSPSGVDAAQTIDGTLEAGKVRQLRVNLKRRANELELEWED